MTNKIPVRATLARAFQFATGDFFKILGTMWIALVCSWVPNLLMQRQMMATGGPPTFNGGMGLAMFALYLVVFILLFMQMIGIARLALGQRQPPYWYYFSLGKPVWRLIGNVLLFLLVVVLGCFILMLGLGLIGAVLKIIGNAANFPALTATLTFVRAILGLAVWCAALYCFVRLSFLLLPVVAAQEPGMALGRAWTLGQGNFWRMFAIIMTVWVPLIALELVVVFFFLLKGVSFPAAGHPEQRAAFEAAMQANVRGMVSGMQHYWFIVYPVAAVIAAFIYGVMIGVQCFAWQALTATGVVSDEVAGG